MGPTSRPQRIGRSGARVLPPSARGEGACECASGWGSCDPLHRRESAARSGAQYQCTTVRRRRATLGMDNQPGSDSVRPVSDLGPFDTDIVLPRFHGLSPLTGSSLDSLLRNSGVRALVVMGVSLNVAIPNLVFDAVNRSYQVVLVSDAVAGVPREYGAPDDGAHPVSCLHDRVERGDRRCLGVNRSRTRVAVPPLRGPGRLRRDGR